MVSFERSVEVILKELQRRRALELMPRTNGCGGDTGASLSGHSRMYERAGRTFFGFHLLKVDELAVVFLFSYHSHEHRTR